MQSSCHYFSLARTLALYPACNKHQIMFTLKWIEFHIQLNPDVHTYPNPTIILVNTRAKMSSSHWIKKNYKSLFYRILSNYKHLTGYPSVYISEFTYNAVGTLSLPKIPLLVQPIWKRKKKGRGERPAQALRAMWDKSDVRTP